MVRREFWTILLAYNLIRITAANAAALHDKQPRQISFTRTCQFVRASWQRLSDSSLTCDELLNQCRILLRLISTCIVANRPGRVVYLKQLTSRQCHSCQEPFILVLVFLVGGW